MSIRQFSRLDEVIMRLDSTLLGLKKRTSTRKKREFPAKSCADSNLSLHEKRHVSGLMRVNHAGEIAAQALYKAQSLTVRDDKLQEIMKESAEEEFDHLYWCEKRLDELDEDISRLTPFWYLGSFCIGFFAGSFGDKWNLGFIAETEHQVVKHLESHIEQLPSSDNRSRAILERMRDDELHHAEQAEICGANELPTGVKYLMRFASKIMTKTSYYI